MAFTVFTVAICAGESLPEAFKGVMAVNWRSQVQWLQTRGYRHDLTAVGRPVVLREEMERHLLGADKKRAAQPRLDLLRSER